MRLSTDGDSAERRYWNEFVADRFPSYEKFWLARVVPLTRRNVDRTDIRFHARDDLAATADEDVALAQLNYTTLLHLGRVHDLLYPTIPNLVRLRALPGPGSAVLDTSAQGLSATDSFTVVGGYPPSRSEVFGVDFDRDRFMEAFVRLAAASDVADEMLQRVATPGTYDPWNEGQGSTARRAWRDQHGDPLRPIRAYRNRLVHGRVVPLLIGGDTFNYPRLDKVDNYLDWRLATDGSRPTVAQDFDRGDVIVSEAWDQAVAYVEASWRSHLVAQ